MSDRTAVRIVVAVAIALVQVGIVGAVSLALGTAHVWPGCTFVAGTGLLWGYRFAGWLLPDRSRS